eukprot:gene28027-49650_t
MHAPPGLAAPPGALPLGAATGSSFSPLQQQQGQQGQPQLSQVGPHGSQMLQPGQHPLSAQQHACPRCKLALSRRLTGGDGAAYGAPLKGLAKFYWNTQSQGAVIPMQHIPHGVRMGRPCSLRTSTGMVTNASVTPRIDLEHHHMSPRRNMSPPPQRRTPSPEKQPGGA